MHSPSSIYVLCVAWAGCLLAGCLSDAAHDNPLDPASENYVSRSEVTGRVTDRLGKGISDAHVRLQAGSFETTSDEEGQFMLSGAPAGTFQIIARKDRFAPARDSVTIQPDERSRVLLPLNALPIYDSVAVRSVHTRRFSPEPTNLYELFVEAQVRDPDDLPGIDSVRAHVGNRSASLQKQEGESYFLSFSESDLPVQKLEALQGVKIYLATTDVNGNRVLSDPHYLTRVIEPTPRADTVLVQSDSLYFRWQPAVSGAAIPYPFPHTYRISLFRQDVNVRVARYAHIAPDRTTFAASKQSRSGAYYWRIDVVDAFGDVSRSLPSGLEIR